MPTIIISFTVPLNEALQIGDIACYSSVEPDGGFDTSSAFTKIGVVKGISQFDGTTSSITCSISSVTAPPTDTSFVFFKKSNKVNQAKVKGYYAKARFTNNTKSTNKAKLYSASAEVFTSSK